MLKLLRKLQGLNGEGVQCSPLHAPKGLVLAGAQEHCFVPLHFTSCGGCFSTFHHIKNDWVSKTCFKVSWKTANDLLGLQSLLCSYGFNFTPAFRLREWADLTGLGDLSCPGNMPHLPSCFSQCLLESFLIKDEFELKQTNAEGLEKPTSFPAHTSADLFKVATFQQVRTKLSFGDDFQNARRC